MGELADDARAAGQHIELTTDGPPEQAPTTHRLAVYRIVQEALTNARKHADGAPVTVRIGYGPPATLVEVTNPLALPARTPSAAATDSSACANVSPPSAATWTPGRPGAGAWRLAARIPHPAGIEQNGTRT